MTTPATIRPKIYVNLEILRFFAAFVIVVYHYLHFTWPLNDYNPAEAPFGFLFGAIYDHGAIAVQFFWILSGFIFFSQYAQRIQDKQVPGRTFAALRFSRLWPLYFSTALFVYLLQPVYQHFAHVPAIFAKDTNPTLDLVLSVFMANQWNPERPMSLNGPSWSVSVEVLVYVFFFILARYLPNRLFWPASLTLALLLPVVVTYGNSLVQCIAYFFAGGIVYWLTNRYSHLKAGLARTALNTVIASAAVALSVLTTIRLGLFPCQIALTFITVIFTAAAILPELTGRKARIATHLGNTTYSSYLIHYPFQLVILTVAAAAGTTLDIHNPWLLISYIAGTYALAFLVYNKFELPAQTWLRRKLKVSGTRASTL